MTSPPDNQVSSPIPITSVTRDAKLGENPIPPEVLGAYPRIAKWSADKPREHIEATVNHWSNELFLVPIEQLNSKHDRGRVFSTINDRLRLGCSVDGFNISIGNIFSVAGAEEEHRSL